jgi:hypothetical protein
MSWITDAASTAWDWATNNVDSIANTVGDFVNNRIDNAERAALLNSQALKGQENPSLSKYQTQNIRSTAGISSFDDIKEVTNNRYASYLYYVKAHLQAKKQYEAVIPSTLRGKTGLGSRK